MAFVVKNHTNPSSFDCMQNFYAWQENAYESRTLILINVIANNLINRIWGEVWTAVFSSSAAALRFFCAW